MNHIADANKMVSDTPRTDAHSWHDGDYDDPLHALSDFARQLERELNAANERIKQLEDNRTIAAANSLANMMAYEDAIAKIKWLEEAGDEMADLLDGKAVKWNKAKKAKL